MERRRMRTWRGANDVGTSEMVEAEPAPALVDLVVSYQGYRERSVAPLERREVPGGRVAMILSFGDTLEVVAMEGPDGRPPGRARSFVTGLSDGPAVTRFLGDQHGMQVDLAPPGVRRLLGVPADVLANRVVPLDAIDPELARLTESLADAAGWVERFTILDRVLAERATTGLPVDPRLGWAYRQIAVSKGSVPVAVLADEIGWSRRHFGARFRAEVGLGPKATARVLRFGRAVELLAAPATSIGAVAAEAGYADQSHLTREFRRLADVAPSVYRRGLTNPVVGVREDALTR